MLCKNCGKPIVFVWDRYQHVDGGLLRCRIKGIFQLTVAEPEEEDK